MSSSVVLFADAGGGQLASKFKPLVAAGGFANDLGDGIKGSYGIVSIKGGRFRIKYKGNETVLTNPDGTPVAYIDVVIIKANAFLNKQYFEGKYAEGVTAPPVCYSLDGVKPAEASTKKQSTTCALCPKNQFGSMVGDNGTKMKACRDTKKLAVVPASDIKNETLGGAMLFRVPPGSLKDLSAMADALKGRGYPYNSVVVRISFDLQASHPKPIFKAIKPLDDDQATSVLEMFESDGVMRVLADNDIVVEHGEEAAAQPAPVQPAGARPAPPPGGFPAPHETAPVPQQKPQLFGMPGSDPAVAVDGRTIEPKPAPLPEVAPTPRVLRVRPDDAPEVAEAQVNVSPPQAANPFAKAATPAQAPAPAAAAPAAKANPFAPPPTVAKKAPVTVESTAVEVPPADNSQLTSDISNILAGLDN